MVCANCEERKATVCCAECKSIGNLLCHVCDRVFHYRQINHTRTLIFRKHLPLFPYHLVCSNCDEEAFTNCIDCNKFFCICCNKVFHYKFPTHNRRDITLNATATPEVKKIEGVSHSSITIHEQPQVKETTPEVQVPSQETQVPPQQEPKASVLEIISSEKQKKETLSNEATAPSPNIQVAAPIKRPLPTKSAPSKPVNRELPKAPTPNTNANVFIPVPAPQETQTPSKSDIPSAPTKAPLPTPVPKTVTPNPKIAISPVKSTVTAASSR